MGLWLPTEADDRIESASIKRQVEKDRQSRIDEFAKAAMCGIIAGNFEEISSNIGIPPSQEVAKQAYAYSEAMEAERERRINNNN